MPNPGIGFSIVSLLVFVGYSDAFQDPESSHNTNSIDGLHMLGSLSTTGDVQANDNIKPLGGEHTVGGGIGIETAAFEAGGLAENTPDAINIARIPGGFANPFFALTSSVDPSGRFSNTLLSNGFFDLLKEPTPQVPSDTIPESSNLIGSLTGGTPVDIPFGNADFGVDPHIGNPGTPVNELPHPVHPSPTLGNVVIGQPILPNPKNSFNSEKTIGLHFVETPTHPVLRQPIIGAPSTGNPIIHPSLRFGGPFVRGQDVSHPLGPIHDYGCLLDGPGHTHTHVPPPFRTTLKYPFRRFRNFPMSKWPPGKYYRPFFHHKMRKPQAHLPNSFRPKVPIYSDPRLRNPLHPRVQFPMRPRVPFPLPPRIPFPMPKRVAFPMSKRVPFPMPTRVPFHLRPRLPVHSPPHVHVLTDTHFHAVRHPFGMRLVPHTTKVVHVHHG